MKIKLLRKVRQRAKACAHWTEFEVDSNFCGEHIVSVSIGYGSPDDLKIYGNVWHYDMDEVTFDLLIRQKYWEKTREQYYLNGFKKILVRRRKLTSRDFNRKLNYIVRLRNLKVGAHDGWELYSTMPKTFYAYWRGKGVRLQ